MTFRDRRDFRVPIRRRFIFRTVLIRDGVGPFGGKALSRKYGLYRRVIGASHP